jgi:3-hydroxybutyryl-CoA dehydrogenase
MTTTIKRVGVAGSGIMGTGIAQVAVTAGYEVLLRTRSQSNADAWLRRLETSLGRQVKKGELSADESVAALGRARAVTDLGELELCDVVVESVVEDLDVKQQLLRDLDRVCPDHTIFATNTSTLPVTDLAVSTARPDRVCGLHFFNPAPKMPLVEVVPALCTSDDTVASLRQFAEDCGKTPVVVKDRAGFVVNALLFPYLNGAVRLLESGVASKEDIDAAMRGGCNFPMGPFELLDLIGIDTSVAVLDRLYAETADPCNAPAPVLRRMVAAGRLGRKSGAGFYDYDTSSST